MSIEIRELERLGDVRNFAVKLKGESEVKVVSYPDAIQCDACKTYCRHSEALRKLLEPI